MCHSFASTQCSTHHLTHPKMPSSQSHRTTCLALCSKEFQIFYLNLNIKFMTLSWNILLYPTLFSHKSRKRADAFDYSMSKMMFLWKMTNLFVMPTMIWSLLMKQHHQTNYLHRKKKLEKGLLLRPETHNDERVTLKS